jgi:hypothetical protein
MRKTVHLAACAMLVPAASNTALMFSSATVVWPSIVASGASRRIPSWPEEYTTSPTRMPGVRVAETDIPFGTTGWR